MFSICCFNKETIERKIPLNNVFNDLRPIFNQLIFQPVNVFTQLKFELSFIFNDLRHIYIRNKVAIFNQSKFGAVNVFTDVKIDVSFIHSQYKNSPPTFCSTLQNNIFYIRTILIYVYILFAIFPLLSITYTSPVLSKGGTLERPP